MSTPDPTGRPMKAKEPFEELERVLETRVRSESATAECVDDDTIAALAAGGGALDPQVRASVVAHVAACPHCRAAVASVARALADPSVAREVAVAEGRRRRFYRIALPVAAAAVLLLLLVSPTADNRGPLHRGPTITATTAPVPLSPVGAVAEAATVRWGGVAGADRYRMTLFEASGRVVYETLTADTAVTLPDSILLAPGRPYLWKVEARTGFDRWTASDLAEFSIVGGRPR